MSAPADRAAAPSERYWLPEARFVVMATIHGPTGWHDVVDTKAGKTVAVCPKVCFARKIAGLLAGEGDVRIDLGPAAGGAL